MTKEQFGERYREGLGMTTRLLKKLGLGADEAEELAQEAWTRGLANLHQLQDDHALVPWVNSIAIRARNDKYRSQKRFQQMPEKFEPAAPSTNHHAKIDVHKTLTRMCHGYAELLVLKYLDELSIALIACRCHLTPAAAHARLARARRMFAIKMCSRH